MQRDIFLNAGDFHFLAADSRPTPLLLRTLLGSCVSIVCWDKKRRAGGMSHSVLPVRSASYAFLDGNHCEGAVALFMASLERTQTRPGDYVVYLVGGSRMSIGLRNPDKVSVGERNVQACRTLLQQAGFRITGEHVGMSGPRRVTLDLSSGRIEVMHNNRTTLLAG